MGRDSNSREEATHQRWLREGRNLTFPSREAFETDARRVLVEFSEMRRRRTITAAEAAALAEATGKALRSALDRPGAPGSAAEIAGYLRRWIAELTKDA